MVNWTAGMTNDELSQYSYLLSDPAKEVPLLDFDTNEKAVICAHNYFEKKFFGRTLQHCD